MILLNYDFFCYFYTNKHKISLAEDIDFAKPRCTSRRFLTVQKKTFVVYPSSDVHIRPSFDTSTALREEGREVLT
jgi:hypothetical protein